MGTTMDGWVGSFASSFHPMQDKEGILSGHQPDLCVVVCPLPTFIFFHSFIHSLTSPLYFNQGGVFFQHQLTYFVEEVDLYAWVVYTWFLCVSFVQVPQMKREDKILKILKYFPPPTKKKLEFKDILNSKGWNDEPILCYFRVQNLGGGLHWSHETFLFVV